jgi:hypothetical protein
MWRQNLAGYSPPAGVKLTATLTKLKSPTSVKKGKTLKLAGTVAPGGVAGKVKVHLFRLAGWQVEAGGYPHGRPEGRRLQLLVQTEAQGQVAFQRELPRSDGRLDSVVRVIVKQRLRQHDGEVAAVLCGVPQWRLAGCER